MKKTSLLLMFGLALFLVSAAVPKAHAGVVVGVSVGAPVYVHPVHPYRYVGPRYGYIAPRAVVAFSPAPVYRRVYVAPAPVYYSHWAPRRYAFHRDFYGYRR